MLNETMVKPLNKQLNKEFYSAYLYLSYSAYARNKGFNGAANWFLVQYQEEITHAMKLFKYLEDQGSDVVLQDIKAVNISDKTLVEVFEAALAHEQAMTKRLNELSDQALKEKDHATYNMLQWYVTEQVEEEAIFAEIINSIRMVGDSSFGIFTIDKELGSRNFVDPTAQ